ncbi:YggS family pyridoxal phosphate-dependent enzyme [Desulfomarina sp.]
MISTNLLKIQEQIQVAARNSGRSAEEIKLIAVSKRFPRSAILSAYKAGQRLFGENYIQEIQQKRKELPEDIHFHFIGHLQTNKAKIAAESCSMIETVDRIKIATAIDRHLNQLDRNLDILVQVNIGEDGNKSGVAPDKAAQLLEDLQSLSRLKIKGLMTIPPYESSPEKTRPHFRNLRILADRLSAMGFFSNIEKIELSMGMSGDFPIAIEEGATIVRVGTSIFGKRPS